MKHFLSYKVISSLIGSLLGIYTYTVYFELVPVKHASKFSWPVFLP